MHFKNNAHTFVRIRNKKKHKTVCKCVLMEIQHIFFLMDTTNLTYESRRATYEVEEEERQIQREVFFPPSSCCCSKLNG